MKNTLLNSNRDKGFINLVRQTNRLCEEEHTTDMVSVDDEYTDLKKVKLKIVIINILNAIMMLFIISKFIMRHMRPYVVIIKK